MTRSRLLSSVLLLTLPAMLCAQTDRGYWRATSKTASSITGDIALSEERLTMNFAPFTLAPIRHIEPVEASAVFDLPADSNPGGELYRLNIPADRKLLHKNTLCGTEDTTYMLTSVDGKSLQVAFFSGAAIPKLTREAVASSTSLCGTFLYSR